MHYEKTISTGACRDRSAYRLLYATSGRGSRSIRQSSRRRLYESWKREPLCRRVCEKHADPLQERSIKSKYLSSTKILRSCTNSGRSCSLSRFLRRTMPAALVSKSPKIPLNKAVFLLLFTSPLFTGDLDKTDDDFFSTFHRATE